MLAQLSSETAQPVQRASRSELGILLVLSLLVSAGLVILTSTHGAYGAARNDDWSYSRVAFDFADNHRFHVDGWIQTILVGHTLLAWPVIIFAGKSIAALQLLGLSAAIAGTVFCYALLRRCLTPAWSAIACLTLVLGPAFASLAMSYMTDTTSFAAQGATLLFGARALETRSPASSRWLLAAAATGLLAFSIREYAIVAFPAVVFVALARSWPNHAERGRITAVAIGYVCLAALLIAWRRALPNTVSPALDLQPGPEDLRALARFAVTLGLFVSPVAFAISPIRAVSAAWRSNRLLTVAAVALAAACLFGSKASFIGNYVTERGSYPNTTIVRGPLHVIPSPVYSCARAFGVYALCIALLVLARALARGIEHVRSGHPWHALGTTARDAPTPTMLAAFTTSLTLVYLAVIALTTGTFFDRYLILLVPYIAALLILAGSRNRLFWRVSRRAGRAAAAAALVAYAAIGFVYVDAAATIDGAKWRTAERLVSAGFPPATIDAGYEWFGFHQTDDISPGWEHRKGDLATRLFSPRPVCATVFLSGDEAAARAAARRHVIVRRSVVRTLLGRDVVVTAIFGPDSCAVGESRTP